MRLAIDGKRLVQARTGPARWLEHMLRNWAEMDVPFEEIRCYTPAETEHGWAAPPKLQYVPLPRRSSPIVWENVVLRRAARRDDLLFGASYTIPLAYGGRSVVSIQGIYEGPHAEAGPFWHRLRFSALYRASARRADLVLANSRSTRDDIVHHYGVDPAKIRIVYQGVGAPFGWRADRGAVAREAAAVLGVDAPYFVFVGNLSPRRHVPELLRAFAEARRKLDPETRLVIIGPNKVGVPLEELVQAGGLADRVIYRTHLDQEALAALYGATLAFVLPTTHEGLSATILEAMACGAPVLTVDHATLHEGFADAALVLPRPEVDLLRDALLELGLDAARRSQLGADGLACAARFSWRATSRHTMDALWEVATR
ncbi:MAG: glycosyltransferase family 4 protein [Gemmatimonadaceae bacterium]